MRLALAPLNPTIGDTEANASLVLDAARHAAMANADVLLCPELVISGYPPKDLLSQEGFVAACARAVDRIAREAPPMLTVIVGLPLFADAARPEAGIHNALVVLRDGKEVARYAKRLLPTYDVFDEDRYFVPGDRPCVIDVPCRGGPTVRVGLAICEDLWMGLDAGFSSRYAGSPDPVAQAVAQGARVLLSPSASPFVLGKGERHRAILGAHAGRHNIHVASVNQLGGNDELIFDGHAFLYAPGGTLVCAGGGFSPGPFVVDHDAPPADTRDCVLLHNAERQFFEALRLGIRDYLAKTGFRKAIIGLSGGIDSALTAALGVAAIGAGNVLGVAMPSRYSSEHSVADALELASRLGCECRTIPIDRGFHALGGSLDEAFGVMGLAPLGRTLPDLTEENLQSRVRGTLLMGLSNRTGAIVLTTGNKSELSVGYCTLYGDMNGGLAVLSDVTKQWVYRLSRWMNANHAICGLSRPPIPERSITKPPSAELRPNQTDQDSLPPYDVLDEIVGRYVEQRRCAATIARETGFDPALVRRIVRMVDLAEYKRKQAAVGLKVTSVAFGSGRRWPIAQHWHGPG